MALVDCREATQLTSAEFDRPLTLRERLRLNVHRLVCGPCRLYRRQLALLRRQASRLTASSPDVRLPDVRLDERARDRIRAHLRDAIDHGSGAD